MLTERRFMSYKQVRAVQMMWANVTHVLHGALVLDACCGTFRHSKDISNESLTATSWAWLFKSKSHWVQWFCSQASGYRFAALVQHLFQRCYNCAIIWSYKNREVKEHRLKEKCFWKLAVLVEGLHWPVDAASGRTVANKDKGHAG